MVDLAIPPAGPLGRKLVGGNDGFCAACWRELEFITPVICHRTGIPLAEDPEPEGAGLAAIVNSPLYYRDRTLLRASAGAVMSSLCRGLLCPKLWLYDGLMTHLSVACVQLCSGCDPADNMAEIDRRVRLAAAAGARLVALPEACTFMEKNRAAMRARLFTEQKSPQVAAFAELARAMGVWLLAGSQFLADEDDTAVNRSLVFAPDGTIAARYDKIHMFDVTLPNGEVHAESQSYKAGTKADMVEVDGVWLGLSICYDMRFPAMYRALASAGAQVLSVPSAFTQVTGEAHWHVLLRARAIENGAYVLAPAQIGTHENGRQTFGHSLIVDPWGTVIAEAGADDDFVMAELDMAAVDKARRALPVFAHGRSFSLSDKSEPVHD